MSKSNDSIAIDLGNSDCCVAFSQNDRVQVLTNTPSFLFLNNSNNEEPKIMLGYEAMESAERTPEFGFFDIKKFIGTSYDGVVAKYGNYYPFPVEPNAFGKCSINVSGNNNNNNCWQSGDNLCQTFFTQLKSNVEGKSGRKFDNVVVTVPPYFNRNHIEMLHTAAQDAQFKKVELIYEPVAVLKCPQISTLRVKGEVIVCDIGGSSLDISVIKVEEENMELLFSAFNRNLGGIDFDLALLYHVFEEMQSFYNLKIVLGSHHVIRKLLNVCKRLKRTFSSSEKFTYIDTCDFTGGSTPPVFISRTVFEKVTSKLVKKYKENLTSFKENYGIDRRQVFICGGLSKNPQIKSEFRSFFTDNDVTFLHNPALCVAEGAAVYAAEIFREDPENCGSHNNSSFSRQVSLPNRRIKR